LEVVVHAGGGAGGAGAGWPATVYIFDCVACIDKYGGGPAGAAVVGAMLQTSLRHQLEYTAVATVVYGCQQVIACDKLM
jgi:hypothetical protein